MNYENTVVADLKLNILKYFTATNNYIEDRLYDVALVPCMKEGVAQLALENTYHPTDNLLIVSYTKDNLFSKSVSKQYDDAYINYLEVDIIDEKVINEYYGTHIDKPSVVFITYRNDKTGAVVQNLGLISELVHHYNGLVVVDMTSGVGSNRLDIEKSKIDMLITSTGFELDTSPGLSIVVYNNKIIELSNLASNKSRYFDLVEYASKNYDDNKYTDKLLLMYQCTNYIEYLNNTTKDRFSYLSATTKYLREELARLGITSTIDEKYLGNCYTEFEIPYTYKFEDLLDVALGSHIVNSDSIERTIVINSSNMSINSAKSLISQIELLNLEDNDSCEV